MEEAKFRGFEILNLRVLGRADKSGEQVRGIVTFSGARRKQSHEQQCNGRSPFPPSIQLLTSARP